MSAILPIGPATRVAGPYVASAGQTSFTYDFALLDPGDLLVETAPAADPENWTQQALGADYSLSPSPPVSLGGAVVFAVGRSAGTRVRISGAAIIANLTDPLPAGPVDSVKLNRWFDRVTIWAQEARRDVASALAALANDVVLLVGNQEIGGQKTFTEPPKVPTPVDDDDAATKGYVDQEILDRIGIKTIVQGEGIDIDLTDPAAPVVSNTGVLSLIQGEGIDIDLTDPAAPVVSNTGVLSLVPGEGIDIDLTDPAHPVLSAPSSGDIEGLVAGDRILIDATNPASPKVSLATTGIVVTVASRTELKALDTTKYKVAYLQEAGRRGLFKWQAGNFSAWCAADTLEGVWIKADAIATTAGAWARVGESPSNNVGFDMDGLHAEWFGVTANSVGTTGSGIDNAPILQAIVDLMDIGNIQKLVLPEGIIRLASKVTIDRSITLTGQGIGLPEAWPDPVIPIRSSGTWLYFDHTGVGIEFTMGAQGPRMASRVEHLTTMRNQPTPASGWAPNAHQPDFFHFHHMVHYESVGLLNPTTAFYLRQSPCSFNHIRAQPMNCFVDVDETYDVCRWNDIHLWPYWSLSNFVRLYAQTHLIVFQFGRCDNPQLSNIFSIWQYQGIRITNTAAGTTSRLKGTNVEFDVGGYGLIITSGASNCIIQLTNFVVFHGTDFAEATRSMWVDGTGHSIQITNVDFNQPGGQCVLVDGSNNKVGICNYRMKEYGEFTANAPGVNVVGTNNTVVLTGIEDMSSTTSVVKFATGGTGAQLLKGSTAAAT